MIDLFEKAIKVQVVLESVNRLFPFKDVAVVVVVGVAVGGVVGDGVVDGDGAGVIVVVARAMLR